MNETRDVVGPILKALIQAGIFAMRINSGNVKVRGGWMRLAPVGTADIVAFPQERRPVWIECKVKGGKLSDDQRAFADRVLDLGHSFWTVESLDEILPLLEGLR